MRRFIRRAGEYRPPTPPAWCGPSTAAQAELDRIGADVEEAMRRYVVAFGLAARAAEAFREARRLEREELRKLGIHRQAENALRARYGLPPLKREVPTEASARRVLARMVDVQALEGQESAVWRDALASLTGGEA